MAFSIQHVLRQLSSDQLKEYLDGNDTDAFQGVWKLPQTKRAAAITKRLVEVDDHISQSVSADLARIYPLATDRGRNALLNAAPERTEFATQFAHLKNDFERALWALSMHPGVFQDAEELHFFDYYSEGTRGQHYRIRPNLPLSRDAQAETEFRSQICAFYQHRDGSGVSCHVEFSDRNHEHGVQITIFVQGLPNSATEFVEGNFRRTISHPALEAAIVYEPESGNVTTVAKGGRCVHEALRDAFARQLLRVAPEYEPIASRRFLLDGLKTTCELPPDVELGVQSVRVRKLKLSPPGLGGHLTVEAPGAGSPLGVHDLGNQWFVEKSNVFFKFQVVQATISMRLRQQPKERRQRTINLELALPNSSNLKSLKESDRQIAEAHIAKWNLIEPSGMA